MQTTAEELTSSTTDSPNGPAPPCGSSLVESPLSVGTWRTKSLKKLGLCPPANKFH